MKQLRSPYRELLLAFLAVMGMSVLAVIANIVRWMPWRDQIDWFSDVRMREMRWIAIIGSFVGIFSIPLVMLLRIIDLRKTIPLVYGPAALATIFIGLDGFGFPFGSMELFFVPCVAVVVMPIVLLALGGWLRRKSFGPDQCLACGYPVGSSPVCTECGATLLHSLNNSGASPGAK